ncbi:hypothetical protein GF325_11820, partial [Candidatus Bathyarchaeota archaeon]|nr:hypothetical protein [Candidatus Bathyarchaeota archaeon]
MSLFIGNAPETQERQDTHGPAFPTPSITTEWWDSSWQYRALYTVNSSVDLHDFVVNAEEVNFTQVLEDLGINTDVDGDFIPESLRVIEVGAASQNEIPYELIPLASGNFSVEWVLNGSVGPGADREFYFYFNNTGASWSKPVYYDSGDIFDPVFINESTWPKVVYYDANYGRNHWMRNPVDYKDYFNTKGYITKTAPELKTWMDIKIENGAIGSVVVMARDNIPDTVAESQSTSNTMRQYLDAGGRILWVADWFLYYQGHAGGGETRWGSNGGRNILGVRGQTTGGNVALTTEGNDWGHQKDWPDGNGASKRPVVRSDVSITFSYLTSATTRAVGWLKNFNSTYPNSGFMDLYPRSDFPGNDPSVQSGCWNMSRKYLSPLDEANIGFSGAEQYFIDLEATVLDLDGLPIEGANVSLYEYNGTHDVYTNISDITNGTGHVNFTAVDPANYSFRVNWELQGSNGTQVKDIKVTDGYVYNFDNDSIEITADITNLVLNLDDLDGDPVEGARVEVFENDTLGTSLANLTTDVSGNCTLRWSPANYSLMAYFIHENDTGIAAWDTGGELNLTDSTLQDIELTSLINIEETVNLSKFVVKVQADTSGDILLGARVNFKNDSLGYDVNLTVQDDSLTFLWHAISTGIEYNVSIEYLDENPLFEVNGTGGGLDDSHVISLQSKTWHDFNVSVSKVETYLNYNITVESHVDSSTKDFLNNNETCTAYWNDLVHVSIDYFYDNGTENVSITGASLKVNIKEVATSLYIDSGFSYSGGLYEITLNTSQINASVGSEIYGKYFNMFFLADKAGFEKNGSQFCTLNLIPYNTSLEVNTTSASVHYSYSLNVSAVYRDLNHSIEIPGATATWTLTRVSSGDSFGPNAMNEHQGGDYSLMLDTTGYELGQYTISIEVRKDLHLVQEVAVSLSIVEIPTVVNGTRIFHYTTSSIINQPWTFYLEYTRDDTGAPLDSASIASFAWENQDTGSNDNGSLTNEGGGFYSLGFQGTELGTYEISINLHQEYYEAREAIITVLVGESDFNYTVDPTSQAIVSNDTAEYRVTVRDRYNDSLLMDDGLVNFVDPMSNFTNGIDIHNEMNGTFTISVRPWNDTIQAATFLLTFRINKSDYTSAFFYVSLTVVDWPIGMIFSKPSYEVFKNEELNISLSLTDTWNGGNALENANLMAEISGISGATWAGLQHVSFLESSPGTYYILLDASDTLLSDDGSYEVTVNASIDIPSLDTYNFTQVTTVGFSIKLRPIIASIQLNQTSVPYDQDFLVELTLADGLNSTVLAESFLQQADVLLGSLNPSYTSATWNYVGGKFSFTMATTGLAIGQYNLEVNLTMDSTLYLDGETSQNLWIVRHVTQSFASSNQSSIARGFDVEFTISVEDAIESTALLEAGVSSITLTAGTLVETFTSANWTFNAGDFSMNLSTNMLSVGRYDVQVQVETDPTYFENGTAVLPIWIVPHDVLVSITPIAPIPFEENTTVEIEVFDLVTSLPIEEANITEFTLLVNGVTTWYDGSNWTYSAGVLEVNLSTSGLSIGVYDIDCDVTLNPLYYNNGSDVLPITIRPRLVEWV